MSMEKYFVDEDSTETIYLEQGKPDERWVKVKSQLSIGDQDALGLLLLDVSVDTQKTVGLSRAERRRQARDGGNLNAKIKPSTVAILQVSLVDWSFVDKDNNKLPLTKEWISRLKPEWANQIEEEIDSLNPSPGQTTPENIVKPLPVGQPHFPDQPSVT